LCEGGYSYDAAEVRTSRGLWKDEESLRPLMWDGAGSYARYAGAVAGAPPGSGGEAAQDPGSGSGISPLAFPPAGGVVIKVNSYEHDERGITTEEAAETGRMYEKRLRKGTHLAREMESYETVRVHGKKDSELAVLCWGSNKGVCAEVGGKLGLRVVQPVVLSPFSSAQFEAAVRGVKKLVSVENNATGQLARLVKSSGFTVDALIPKYDGRPFSYEELEAALKRHF
jgi:2-oxoglutarate ferredoxin oxidoreductase subunit alpha